MVVARTVVGVGEEWYVVTAVERGGVVVFVTNVDRLGGGVVVPVYGCSVEQHLLDVTAKGKVSEACEMITSLGRLGASGSVRAGLEGGGYVFPSEDTAVGIVGVVKTVLTDAAGLSVAVIGMVRCTDVIYAVVVPYVPVSGTAVEAYGLPYMRKGANGGLRVTGAGARHVGAAVVVMQDPRSIVYVYFVVGWSAEVPIGVIFRSRDGKYTGTVWSFESGFSALTEHEELSEFVSGTVPTNVRLIGCAIGGAITRIGSYMGDTGGGMYTMLSIWEGGAETAKHVYASRYGEASVREKLTYMEVGEEYVFQDLVCEEGVARGGFTGLRTVRRDANPGEMEVVWVESARGVRLVERELRGVKVGKQTWTAENVDVGEYGDGEEIEEAQSAEAWEDAYARKVGAWCYHPENAGNGKKWGKLYNVYALGKLCPRGWRFPTEADWGELINVGCGGDVKKLIEGEFKAGFPVGFRAESKDIPSWLQKSFWFCGLDTKEGLVSFVGIVGSGMSVTMVYSENQAVDYDYYLGAGFSVRLIKESSV